MIGADVLEQQIMEKFGKLGYSVNYVSCGEIEMHKREDDFSYIITIEYNYRTISAATIYDGKVYPKNLTMEEFKLLNELFTIWGWN